MNKNESILRFYVLTNTLKTKIRQGTNYWNVDVERKDSIAEHIYSTCMLAIAISSECEVICDLDKILQMLLIHELEEIYIGDITPFDGLTADEIARRGRKAVEKILEPLNDKEYYLNLLDEFNAHETREARFAYFCDKLEFDLQMILYTDQGKISIDRLIEYNSPVLNSLMVKRLVESGAAPVEIFYEFDKEKFKDDIDFSNLQYDAAYTYNLKELLEKYLNSDKV